MTDKAPDLLMPLLLILVLALLIHPAQANVVVLEGSDANGVHCTQPGVQVYTDQLLTGLKGTSALPVLVLKTADTSACSIASSPVPHVFTTSLGSAIPTFSAQNYSALYIMSPGGCCDDGRILVSDVDQATIASFVKAGGSLGIQDFEGGGWSTALGFTTPPSSVGGVEPPNATAGGPVCFDGNTLASAGVTFGFTAIPTISCFGHQAYDMSFFGPLGYSALVLPPAGDFPAGFATVISLGNASTTTSGQGTINIDSAPTGAGFQLLGPGLTSFTGITSFSVKNVPAGVYTITWNIPLGGGFITPAPESELLTKNGAITFIGKYTQTAASGLLFPIQGKTAYTAGISSVTDHNRDPNIIVSYAGERGRRVDGVQGDKISSTVILDAFEGYHPGATPLPAFVVNGRYNLTDNTALFYEYQSGTYQHPGYDYPFPDKKNGVVIAPISGELWLMRDDPINGKHLTTSAWCGFHTFKIVHFDGSGESWFLHTDHLLNAGDHGAIQNLEQLAQSAVGGMDVYNCKSGTVVPVSTDDGIKVARVTSGEALAIIGDTGVKGQIHLHHEVRNGSPCDAVIGKDCLIDPFGWEGDSTDPLPHNPGTVMWQGYVQPTITSATINSQTLTLTVTGFNLVQASSTTVEIWHQLDEVVQGADANDGTKVATNVITVSATPTSIIATVAPEVIANVTGLAVKVAVEKGPRSKAFPIVVF